MIIQTSYSENFSKKLRKNRDIKVIVIHYTGMQSKIESIKRLMNPKHKVSAHYLIDRKGKILRMVDDNKIAWHAGKSKWKNFKNLNNNSIGIELVNKGHEFGYQNFSNIQITSLINLCKNLKKKHRIKKENFLGHSDIAPLRKIDPGKKFPWKKLSMHNIGNWYSKKEKKIEVNLKKIEHSFFKNLQKLGYRYFSVKNRKSNDQKIIKSFQSHYLPNRVTGKVDQKTFEISHFLTH